MAIPSTGFLRIFPFSTTITSGAFSVSGTGVGASSALATAADLQAYYDLHADTPAVAPRLRFIDEVPAASTNFVPAPGTYELAFDPDTSRILFDPSGVAQEIDFLSASFPMGCLMNNPRLWFNGEYVTGPARNRQLTDISLKYKGVVYKSVTPVGNLSGDIAISNDYAILPFGVNWTPIQAFGSMGWSSIMSSLVDANVSIPMLRNDLFFIQWIYDTTYFQFTLNTPNALPGNLVDISDANSHFDQFDEDLFKIYWDTTDPDEDVNPDIPGWTGGVLIPRSHIIEFTVSRFKFILVTNQRIPYGGKRLMVTGTAKAGAHFVGEVPIANLNVQLVDGSGVYNLTANQPYDIYYDRSTTPVTTVNLKIPDPYAKTGYFNS